MTRTIRHLNHSAVLLACLLLAGCGLFTSDEDRMQRANDAFERGAYRAATVDLKTILQENPNRFDARFMLARISLGLGDTEAARKEYERIVGAVDNGIDPQELASTYYRILLAERRYTDILSGLGSEEEAVSDADARYLRGRALLGLGQFTAAEEHFRAWQANPAVADRALALDGLATALAFQNDLDGARVTIEEAHALAPDDVEVNQTYGTVLYTQEDYAGSVERYDHALAQLPPQTDIPRYLEILTRLITSSLASGNIDLARERSETLTATAPNLPITNIREGQVALAENRYTDAADSLQKALRATPDNAFVLHLLGLAYFQSASYAQAETYLRRSIASQRTLPTIKLLAQVQLLRNKAAEAAALLESTGADDQQTAALLGQAKARAGEADAAIEYLERAVESFPEDSSLQLDLAASYLASGEIEKAVTTVRNVDTDSAELNVRRERILLLGLAASNDANEAVREVERLIRDYPEDDTAQSLGGVILFAAGDLERGQAALERAVEINPENAGAHLMLARVAFAAEDNARARARLVRVLEIDENHLQGLVALADLETLEGNAAAAGEYLERADRSYSDIAGIKIRLARAKLGQGDLAAAERLARRAGELAPESPEALALAGGVLLQAGKPEEAEPILARLVEQVPGNTRFLLALAQSQAGRERYDKARDTVDQAIALEPENIDLLAAKIVVESLDGKLDRALAIANDITALDPNGFRHHMARGFVYFQSEDYGRAAAAYDAALAAGGPRNAATEAFRARKAGNLPGAESSLRVWLERNPDDPTIQLFLAQEVQAQGNADAAARHYLEVLESQPRNAIALNNYAWILHERGDDRAVEFAQLAYDTTPENGDIADTLGWILVQTGDVERGLEYLTKASRQAPNNPEIGYHLAYALVQNGAGAEARRVLQRALESEEPFPSRTSAQELFDAL